MIYEDNEVMDFFKDFVRYNDDEGWIVMEELLENMIEILIKRRDG